MNEREYRELFNLLHSIRDDLQVMLRIPAIPHSTGNCCAPMLLYSMTSASFLGSLVAPERIGKDQPAERITAFLEYSDGTLTAGIDVAKVLDGLVSSFLPPKIGIGRDAGVHCMETNQGTFPVVNAEDWASAVMYGIGGIEARMACDTEFAAQLWDRVIHLGVVAE